MARYDGGQITLGEVDQRILALPMTERPKPGEPLDAWYTGQIREMVVERRLFAEAETGRLFDDPDFETARREAEKRISLELCLSKALPEIEPVTDDELREVYDAHPEQFSAPERRLTYEIFLRRAPGAAETIRSLRERTLRGESFLRLAGEYSDSESRLQDGLLGWMVPGRLPAPFGAVVAGLDEGVPSKPVETPRGFHLFYVEQILPAKLLSFEEAAPNLRRQRTTERREKAIDALLAEAPTPPGSLVLDRKEFAKIAQAGDPSAVVLRIGEQEVTLGDLRTRVRAVVDKEAAEGSVATVELAWRVLEQVRRRETLAQRCQTEGWIPADTFEERMAAWRRASLTSGQRHRRLLELAEQDETQLRLFYESNVGSFSKPPTWTLRRLRVPLGQHPLARMESLEAAASGGGTTLDDLKAKLGGEIDDLGALTQAEMKQVQPKLPKRIAPLGAGQLAAPYRTQAGFEVVEVVDRAPATPIPFDEARKRVTAAYVAQYTAELYDRLEAQILDQAKLEILPKGLEALKAAALPEPDVSVEQLNDLFEDR
ncbi:MAG: peptidyl-prolyl cis-trans isomerase [Acidobacteria bacterium]|nr:peptidyl-prolyl cis-trans isomerase [Acidobacteriota bacterium]